MKLLSMLNNNNPIYITLVNRLLSGFNLEWTNIGLRYTYKLNYGEVSYFITSDFSKVLSFLNIEYTDSTDIEYLYLVFTNSKFFNKERILKYPTTDIDYMRLKAIISLNKPFNSISKFIPNHTQLNVIDRHFKCNLKYKTSVLDKVGITENSIRLKFNGKLVMRWSNISSSKLLAETIEDFKSYIETTYTCEFLTYLFKSKPSTVKDDFSNYYNHLDIILGTNP